MALAIRLPGKNHSVNPTFTYPSHKDRDSLLRHALSLDGATHTSGAATRSRPFLFARRLYFDP